ncbi:sorting nexin-17 [Drosophila willistoni]|uniref:sorting nexin-17 n=1 Tax=Drosophila willistoni TaxID=7260 RepID=UPI001F084E71|nr:sorting nexin-17 [Drosophila willistoni]
MHFSIPDTQEDSTSSSLSLNGRRSGNGNGYGAPTSTFTVYNIYLNGNFHCCLRYKQLHALNEQLRRRCLDLDMDVATLPPFPPKRLLPLTNSQLETRRAALEHYLQIIGQDGRIARLPYLQQFLQRAQLETALTEGNVSSDQDEQKLEVMVYANNRDGRQLLVNCHVQQNASSLLERICRALHLPDELRQYFCLYLMRREAETDQIILLRRLMDFEAPFITRLHAQPCQLLLRTCYWNPRWDTKLLGNKVALDLLYQQTVADVYQEWIICNPEMRRQLNHLQAQGHPLPYLELASQLPSYGCLQFRASSVDYPEPETSALITIGNKELSLRSTRGHKIYETKFRVTRMRCWRVSALHNTFESRDQPSQLQLAFEYLMSKQTLRWITITSEQAMLMSVCLQAMVDELLHGNGSDGGNGDSDDDLENVAGTSGSSLSTPSSVSSTSTSNATSSAYTMANTNTATIGGDSINPPVKFLAQRLAPTSRQQHKLTTARTFAAVFFRNDSRNGGEEDPRAAVRNEAFEGIGDDDL